MGFFRREFPSVAHTATALSVLVEPIDVSNMEKFAICFNNSNTAISATNIVLQYGWFSNLSGTEDNRWVNISTASIPVPSGLNPSETFFTSAIENAHKYIRALGILETTATQGSIQLRITGFERFGRG